MTEFHSVVLGFHSISCFFFFLNLRVLVTRHRAKSDGLQ